MQPRIPDSPVSAPPRAGAIGSDAMFGAPVWSFTDAYSANAPTYMYRFDHTTWTLRALGLGAIHGSEIVHIQHSYSSYIGRKLHPLARRVQPSVGHAAHLAGLRHQGLGERRNPVVHRPELAVVAERRASRVILSARDLMVDDPDAERGLGGPAVRL
jgi:para-nitrobenzyl esterase